MEKLFVYGSLLQGFWNYDKVLRHRVHKVEKATIKGDLYQLPEGYPVALPGQGEIHGEVFTLSQKTSLKNIDLLEGYIQDDPNSLYRRDKIDVKLEDGSIITCWFYNYLHPDYVLKKGKRIPHGDWSRYILSKPF